MSDEQPFAGQFLHVWSKGPAQGGPLKDACIRQLGSRAFVVGTMAGKNVTARTGLTVWIPVDEVLMITEFPDKARIQAASAEWEERRGHSPDGGGKS
jgi:hypothetical protein